MPEISQEELDQIKNDLRILKFQQQEAQDTLESGITSHNLASFRNTYVINTQDSLDASYPMYVHFNIISEMIKIVSVKVSFWILNYRAYSKAGASGGGQTSSATGSASGGGATSGANNDLTGTQTEHVISSSSQSLDPYSAFIDIAGILYTDKTKVGAKTCYDVTHQHYMGDHTHSTPDHTHPTHTHTIDDHTHDAVYGIYEEDTSPTIKFYVSENEGVSYNDIFFGGYDKNKSDLEITSLLTGAGSKLIKFESDLRARLSVQIEIKVDIRAR